jgi:endogenous inhibitor of DNA gyrase (YacG/DUF329 family)
MCAKVIENAPDQLPCRPFCSPSCKLADLGNWMSEVYRIPGPVAEDDVDHETAVINTAVVN